MLLLHVLGLSILSTGFLGILTVVLFFHLKYRHWKGQSIRCLTPIFPFGNAWTALFRKHLAIAFKDIYDQFPNEKFNGLWVIHRPYIMFRDLDMIKNIFIRDFAHFQDRGFYFSKRRDPLAGNLFMLKGPKWRNIRMKMTPIFTSGRMKIMFNAMVERAEKLVELWQESAETQAEVEVKDFVARYANDVVTACMLGVHGGSLEDPSAIFRALGKTVFEASWRVHMRTAMCFLVPDLAHLFHVINTPLPVRQFFLPFIKDLFKYRETHDQNQQDLIHLVVKLKKQGFIHEADCNGNEDESKTNAFTFADAAAQAFIFWIGGFETSATTIQFALYEMALNTGIQDAARKEVEECVNRYGSTGNITYEALHQMTYLAKVVEETLRKYPPVAIINRECSRTYHIPHTDVIIERGVSVIVSVLGIHMDPQHYPDPNKFDPDRFSEEQKKRRHHYAFLPFGEGPHSCIGQRFARMQIRVCLAVLLQNYRFSTCDATPTHTVFDKKLLVYTTKDGIPLRVSRVHADQ